MSDCIDFSWKPLRILMRIFALALIVWLCAAPLMAKTADGSPKIVLIAGSKGHGPGSHEYAKSVRLIKVMFDRSPSLKGVKTEIYFDGWPVAPSTFETADTIVFISDGMQWLPWTFAPERVALIQRQMDRGCGFMTFHFATYVGDAFSMQALAWNGGYIKYDGPNPESYSTYKTLETDVIFPSPQHEVMRGLQPFHIKEEFYYKAAFVPGRQGVTPLLRIPNLPVDSKGDPAVLAKPEDQIPVWAFERKGGGRSIGATFGHSYSSWKNDDYRKLVLNAIVWTAKIKVPRDGVESVYLDDAEVEKVLGPTPAPVPSPLEPLKTP